MTERTALGARLWRDTRLPDWSGGIPEWLPALELCDSDGALVCTHHAPTSVRRCREGEPQGVPSGCFAQ